MPISQFNIRDDYGNSAIIIAAANNNLELVEKLIYLTNPMIKNYEGQTALHRACYYGHV